MTPKKRLVEGYALILGGLAGLVLVWYGYGVLKKATLSQAIFVGLFFGSGLLVGVVYLTAKHSDLRWFTLDPRDLDKNQNLVLGIGALLLAVCSLWLAVASGIPVIFGGVVGKIFLVIGFFYFGWHAWLKLQQAFQPSHKE